MIDELLKREDIVIFVNDQEIQWLSHLEQTDTHRMPKKILRAQVYKSRKRGRPRRRWLDDILEYLRRIDVRACTEMILDRRL